MEDRKSWEIKDEAILDDLVALMSVNDDEKALLGALQSHAQDAIGALGEEFYARLLGYANTSEFFKDDKMIEHVKKESLNWFVQLFSGDYGSDYVNSRLVIGQVHVRIGLPVRYPLAMMDVVLKHGGKVASQSSQPAEAKDAFHKLLALDIAIFNQAYENKQLQHLAETVGNERLARRLLTQG